ncbi:16211_t:CDS:2 [Racocetra persica]|uniref:16211_t:CDS:1 n=1 Tax=Racocetra persica TaxID=160502 RepID=A0ACA9KAY7_9GLOM|nr:16211_t:CDS:2 [Racocetra persica]
MIITITRQTKIEGVLPHKEASFFVQRVSNYNESNNDIKGNKISNTEIIDYKILNDKQKTIFRRIESYYYRILIGCQVEPLKIIIIETANIAIFNINDETIYSVFSILIPIGNNLDITGEQFTL